MRHICLSFTFLLHLTLSAQPHIHAETGRHGMHGMVLFSDGSALYASHLPMFHPPHDVQLILRIKLQNKQVESALVKVLSSQKDYWTLAPERFDLNFISENSKSGITRFKADLYRGHFERGGEKMFSQQMIVITKIVLKRVLTKAPVTNAQFIKISPSDAPYQFYVRIINGQPGIDQIFWLENSKHLPEQLSINTSSLLFDIKMLTDKLGIAQHDIQLYYQEMADLR